jgi:hypothetical protein
MQHAIFRRELVHLLNRANVVDDSAMCTENAFWKARRSRREENAGDCVVTGVDVEWLDRRVRFVEPAFTDRNDVYAGAFED